MFRRLKAFAASLALFALLGVQVHILAHVFGHDHDATEAPCQVCMTVLSHQALGTVAQVAAPEAPTAVASAPVLSFVTLEAAFVRPFDSRGPPASTQA
jgi:hypothetical protein